MAAAAAALLGSSRGRGVAAAAAAALLGGLETTALGWGRGREATAGDEGASRHPGTKEQTYIKHCTLSQIFCKIFQIPCHIHT